jgi:hypothetical protein
LSAYKVDKRTSVKLDPAAEAIIRDAVRAEITALPTYGYRRAGALVNRTRRLIGFPPVNHKRRYRTESVVPGDGISDISLIRGNHLEEE